MFTYDSDAEGLPLCLVVGNVVVLLDGELPFLSLLRDLSLTGPLGDDRGITGGLELAFGEAALRLAGPDSSLALALGLRAIISSLVAVKSGRLRGV